MPLGRRDETIRIESTFLPRHLLPQTPIRRRVAEAPLLVIAQCRLAPGRLATRVAIPARLGFHRSGAHWLSLAEATASLGPAASAALLTQYRYGLDAAHRQSSS